MVYSIGGVVQVVVENMPVGVGSYVHYDRKLDGRIAQGVVSINAFKGVSFGEGFKAAEKPGSEIQDEILYNTELGYYRGSNHLGGFRRRYVKWNANYCKWCNETYSYVI